MASTPAQIEEQIRFALSVAGEKNRFMEFENLCRHIAKARICSNTIPSTGPVSGGGDGGVDFQSFRHLIEGNNGIFHHLNISRIAFCCSFDVKFRSKILKDIEKIAKLKQGYSVVYFFSTVPIQASRSNEIRKIVKSKHKIDLTIIDALALADMLSDPDLFWAASQYLSIPAEIFPKLSKEDEDYYVAYKKWEVANPQLDNYSDFIEIKTAARDCVGEPGKESHLNMWIPKMEIFRQSSIEDLRKKSLYELIYLNLRGIGNLHDKENFILDYLSNINELEACSDIKDASIIISYAFGAVSHSAASIDNVSLRGLRDKLKARIEQLLLEEGVSETRECLLRLSLGNLLLNANNEEDIKARATAAALEWSKIVNKIENCHLFPISDFSSVVEFMSGSPVGEQFREIEDKLLKILEVRYGQQAMADKHMQRAIQFAKSGYICLSINEVHQAKFKWYTKETYDKTIRACLHLSVGYLTLGLPDASKYYALMAAHASENFQSIDESKYIARSFAMLTDIAYRYGRWNECLHWAYSWSESSSLVSSEKDIDEEMPEIVAIMQSILLVLKNHDEDLYKQICDKYNFPKEILSRTRAKSDELSNSEAADEINKLADSFRESIGIDFCTKQHTRWRCFGILWIVESNSLGNDALASAELAVYLQVILGDLFDVDLIMMHTTVHIHCSSGENFNIQRDASNTSSIWQITLNERAPRDSIEEFILKSAIQILFECSLLDSKSIEIIFDNKFRHGLHHKLQFAGNLPDVVANLAPPGSLIAPKRNSPIAIVHDDNIIEHSELRWKDSDYPNYSKERAIEAITNRYNNSRDKKWDLIRSAKYKTVVEFVSEKRMSGRKDWAIYMAVLNSVMTYRMERVHGKMTMSNYKECKEFSIELMRNWEKYASIFPEESFFISTGILNIQFKSVPLLCAQVYGMECRQRTPNDQEIFRVLASRFHYDDLDVEHENYYPSA